MKKTLVITVASLILIGALGLFLYVETHNLAPHRLNVRRLLISDTSIPESFNGVRIVFFSDIHLYEIDEDTFDKVFASIQALQPDLIVFGGDLLDESSPRLSLSQEAELITSLSELSAPLGKFAILGQHDLNHLDQILNVYKLSNFEVLTTQVRRLYRFKDDFIELHSTDLTSNTQSLSLASTSTFSLLLSYDPEVLSLDNVETYSLVLAAKTHGGQATLPFYGPLFEEAQQTYYRGIKLDHSPAYIISNGIATLAPRYRWLTPPSIYILELKRQP